jgi:hypothetical protein
MRHELVECGEVMIGKGDDATFRRAGRDVAEQLAEVVRVRPKAKRYTAGRERFARRSLGPSWSFTDATMTPSGAARPGL